MAKINGGIFSGIISGKLGNKVYCRRGKTSYVRSMPAKSAKEPTEAQAFRRNGFKLITAFVKPLASLLKLHFGGSWHNMVLKLNLSFVLIPAGTEAKIDYSKVKLSDGKLSRVHIKEAILLSSGELLVEWEGSGPYTRPTEMAVILVYCPSTGIWHYVITDYSIEDCLASMVLPSDMLDKELQGYMYFRDRLSGAVSGTMYLGTISAV